MNWAQCVEKEKKKKGPDHGFHPDSRMGLTGTCEKLFVPLWPKLQWTSPPLQLFLSSFCSIAGQAPLTTVHYRL